MQLWNEKGGRTGWLKGAAVALLPLALAGCETPPAELAAELPDSPAAAPAAQPSYISIAVHPGDTLSEIAQRYRVSVRDIERLNGLDDPRAVRAGQNLKLPGPARPTRAAPPQLARRSRNAAPKLPMPPGSPIEIHALPAPKAAAQRELAAVRPRPRVHPGGAGLQKADSAPQAEESRNAAPRSGAFEWPVEGRVVAPFGESGGGLRNDGINIAAAPGTPIHAAAGGVVTYAARLKGYGELILIRHDNGYVTVYAHAQSLLVSRGDRVARGDVIGYAGKTGDVETPQLHFEIRRGVTPLNPESFLLAGAT